MVSRDRSSSAPTGGGGRVDTQGGCEWGVEG